MGWPSGVRASGTLSDGDGAPGGQHGHAERSEASRRPARQTLRYAQGDKKGPAERSQMAMARQEDSTVMLSAAKHLDAQRDRPFAMLRVTVENIEAMFVQSASGLASSGGSVTFHGLARSTLFFANRPKRVLGGLLQEVRRAVGRGRKQFRRRSAERGCLLPGEWGHSPRRSDSGLARSATGRGYPHLQSRSP